MFLHLSVSHSVHREGTWTGNPLEQCMLGDTGNKWAVRILLVQWNAFLCFEYFEKGTQPPGFFFRASLSVKTKTEPFSRIINVFN